MKPELPVNATPRAGKNTDFLQALRLTSDRQKPTKKILKKVLRPTRSGWSQSFPAVSRACVFDGTLINCMSSGAARAGRAEAARA